MGRRGDTPASVNRCNLGGLRNLPGMSGHGRETEERARAYKSAGEKETRSATEDLMLKTSAVTGVYIPLFDELVSKTWPTCKRGSYAGRIVATGR